jgi:uncharacterized protein YdeI (YjbR/CyaY-like superfamily)
VQHAERLIAQGHMQAAGLAQVEAARSDGRWASAYAGSATMVMPEDFLAALQNDPAAHAFYATLKRQSLFTIYHRLHFSKRSDTRQKRVTEMLEKLGGESLRADGVRGICWSNWAIFRVEFAHAAINTEAIFHTSRPGK